MFTISFAALSTGNITVSAAYFLKPPILWLVAPAVLDHNHDFSAEDENPVADPDRAVRALSDSLLSSRAMLHGSRTLFALVQCPGPALHDPTDD